MPSFKDSKLKATKVACSKCKEKKFVNPIALEQRIAKYGSIEEIEKKWICRTCSNDEKAAEELEQVKINKDKRMSKDDKKLKPSLSIATGPMGEGLEEAD